jgi:hypothetical protein
MDTVGGFVPVDWSLRHIPTLSIFGDGRIVTQGPQIEIYPGPALPALTVRTLEEEGIQAIMAAAADAGLLGPDRHLEHNCIADAGTTVFTVVADGRTHLVSAYALGFESEPEPGQEQPPGEPGQGVGEPGWPGQDQPTTEQDSKQAAEPVQAHQGAGCIPDDQIAPRAALAAFETQLTTLESWLPAGSLGDEEVLAVDRLRLFVGPYASPDQDLDQPPMAWPLEGEVPLEAFGAPLPQFQDIRCGDLDGVQLSPVLHAAQQANQLTPWVSGEAEFGISFRPLLPDETGCDELQAPGF